MMKDSKYSVSGIIHSSGTDAISVLMKLVKPSNRLEGTNAKEAADLLDKSDLHFEVAKSLQDAAQKVTAVLRVN